MSQAIKGFELFGSIGDATSRKKIAESIFERLSGRSTSTNLVKSDAGNFTSAIDAILSDETMKELCASDPDLAEKVTGDILEFINGASKTVARTDSPFDDERQFLDAFRNSTEISFEAEWSAVKDILNTNYPRRTIDCEFYQKEFRKSLTNAVSSQDNAHSFTVVKEHFLEKWETQLFHKQAQWELQIIDDVRKQFCDELYAQMQELKELKEIFDPLNEELGRLWDLSNGKWRRTDIVLLKRYASFLKDNQSVKELVELLGRMRNSERALEEEMFTDKIITQVWRINQSGKADLIGVRESDDLSSLLPSEVALLADRQLETVFLKKYAEKKLQTFEYQARNAESLESEIQKQRKKPDVKGPIIICIDTSGSMHGTPELVAKTVAFAFTKMALREQRKVFLISFSTGIEKIDLSDMRNSLQKTLAFLSMNFNGGTDAAPALNAAVELLKTENYKRADVLMISDFVMQQVATEVKLGIEQAKENGTKFHSLVISNSANQKVLKCFDHDWYYDTSNPDSMLQLIRNISVL